jgi:hypothetical protein
MEAMPPRLCDENPRPDHVRPPSGELASFGRMVRCGDVEDRQIQMLELQPLLACQKRARP